MAAFTHLSLRFSRQAAVTTSLESSLARKLAREEGPDLECKPSQKGPVENEKGRYGGGAKQKQFFIFRITYT